MQIIVETLVLWFLIIMIQISQVKFKKFSPISIRISKFLVKKGDRIAQLICEKIEMAELIEDEVRFLLFSSSIFTTNFLSETRRYCSRFKRIRQQRWIFSRLFSQRQCQWQSSLKFAFRMNRIKSFLIFLENHQQEFMFIFSIKKKI